MDNVMIVRIVCAVLCVLVVGILIQRRRAQAK